MLLPLLNGIVCLVGTVTKFKSLKSLRFSAFDPSALSMSEGSIPVALAKLSLHSDENNSGVLKSSRRISAVFVEV